MTEIAVQDGWNAFSLSDLVEVLTGSDRSDWILQQKAKPLKRFWTGTSYQSIDLTYEPPI